MYISFPVYVSLLSSAVHVYVLQTNYGSISVYNDLFYSLVGSGCSSFDVVHGYSCVCFNRIELYLAASFGTFIRAYKRTQELESEMGSS